MIRQVKVTGLLLLLGFGLAGCSAHPGSGNWGLVEGEKSPFSKVLVHFEGRAELIDAASGKDRHHCFWSGRSATRIQMDCTTPEDTETRLHYYLQVREDGKALLFRDDKQIGVFKRIQG